MSVLGVFEKLTKKHTRTLPEIGLPEFRMFATQNSGLLCFDVRLRRTNLIESAAGGEGSIARLTSQASFVGNQSGRFEIAPQLVCSMSLMISIAD
jgi:hypothetical protein